MRNLRYPNFAGIFYPSKKEELLDSLTHCFNYSDFGPKDKIKKSIRKRIYGLIVPHAAYVFSGAIAAHAYYEISDVNADTFILIGPDHNGIGSKVSMIVEGSWKTPLGIVEINNTISEKIMNASSNISIDVNAHNYEHSLEVQIPFLQHIKQDNFTIVPILLKDQDSDTAIELGKSVSEATRNTSSLIIATSDLTHYETYEQAYNKDLELIKKIERLDIESFYRNIRELNVSLCGQGPIAALIKAVKLQGAKNGILLKYSTSGDTECDYKNTVVGYSSIAMI
ncbi:MAG: AmmeMemoRadiSam system protein B [Nitrososphaeraceae archaeon]